VVGLEAEYTISGRALLQIVSITIARGERVIIKREKSIRGEKGMKGARTIRLTGNETDAELTKKTAGLRINFDPVKVFNEISDEEWCAALKRLGFTLLSEREANSTKDTQGNSKSVASRFQGIARKVTKRNKK
jgi:hypothetical protein